MSIKTRYIPRFNFFLVSINRYFSRLTESHIISYTAFEPNFLTTKTECMENQTTTARKNDAPKDVYQIINDKIIEQLNLGTVPWRQPWSSGGLPQNIISKKYYRGINLMLLAMEGYEHNLFITFKQLNEIGGKVKKDEKGHMVVYWNYVEKTAENSEKDEEKETKKSPFLRYYTVFNISQCENLPERYLPKTREVQEILSCEQVVKNMPECPPIRHKEQKAFYNPLEDFVNMPKKNSFKSDSSYYSTLFHELVHSTGHHTRLKRPGLIQMAEFGDETYSHEELVAEIGTCYLQSITGITGEFLQSTAYIQGWLTKLKNDKRFIFSASSLAQKAIDYILNIKDAKEDMQQGEE
jgi:antirestriction protein ArdC